MGTRKGGEDYNSQGHSARFFHRSSEECDKDNRDKDRDSKEEARVGTYNRRRGDYSHQEESAHRKTYQE